MTRIRRTMRYLLLALALTFLLFGRAAATGEINVLTDLQSPFPPGCVAVSLPQDSASADNELHDVDVTVPSVEEGRPAGQVRITIWRTGCHDEGFSIVMVRLEKLSGGPILVPRAFAEAGEVDLPGHQAQLIRHPAVGDVGASGNELVGATTYMVGVDPFPLNPENDTSFTPADYNDLFTLELFWGDYARTDPSLDFRLFTIPEYDPQLDPTQTEFPILHGRMSGQYTVEGLPVSGLVFQVGEEFTDTNNVTAIFFTYIDGAPFWVFGALGGIEPGFDQVTLDMFEFHGGEFITSPPESYSREDIDEFFIGTMTIEALDCNRLLVGYNFSEGGLGTGSFEADRLIRIAGYDCNPWR